MARQGINTGSAPDAGDGDSLLIGAIKINANFSEIYSAIGDGSNITNSIGYATTAGIATYASSSRVVVKDSGSTVGTAGTIDFGTGLSVSTASAGIVTVSVVGYATEGFVGLATAGLLSETGNGINLSGIVTSITNGSGITIDQSTGNVTISATGGGGESYWSQTAAGIHTLSNVGVGTTNPTSDLTVFGNNLKVIYSSGVNPGINLDDTSNKTLIGMSYSTSSDDSILISDEKNIKIKVRSPQDVYISADDETMAVFQSNGSVTLYYNNSKKFETIGAGVIVTGTTFTNQLSVSGVSTFSGNVRVGVDTSSGVILTSPNGTQYRLIVDNAGTLSTVAV